MERRELHPAERLGDRRRRFDRRRVVPRFSQVVLADRLHRRGGAHLPDHSVEDHRARGPLVRYPRQELTVHADVRRVNLRRGDPRDVGQRGVVGEPALVLDVGDGEVPAVLRGERGHRRRVEAFRVSGKLRVKARNLAAPVVPIARGDRGGASLDELCRELTRGVVGFRGRGLRGCPVVAGIRGFLEEIRRRRRPLSSRHLDARANGKSTRRQLGQRVDVIRARPAEVRLQHVRPRRAARRLHVVLGGDVLGAPLGQLGGDFIIRPLRLLERALGRGRGLAALLLGRRVGFLGRRGFLASLQRSLVRLLRRLELGRPLPHLLLSRGELLGRLLQRSPASARQVDPERLSVHLALGFEQLVFPARVEGPRPLVRVLRSFVRLSRRSHAELDFLPGIRRFVLGVVRGGRGGRRLVGVGVALGLRWRGDGGLGGLGHLREREPREAVEPAVHGGPRDLLGVDQRVLDRGRVDAADGAGVEDHREGAPLEVELGERLLGLRMEAGEGWSVGRSRARSQFGSSSGQSFGRTQRAGGARRGRDWRERRGTLTSAGTSSTSSSAIAAVDAIRDALRSRRAPAALQRETQFSVRVVPTSPMIYVNRILTLNYYNFPHVSRLRRTIYEYPIPRPAADPGQLVYCFS